MDYKNTTHDNNDTKPVDNKTYVECHDNHEENADERTRYFADLWKTTNFWLSIIGLYFFGKIIFAVIKFLILLHLGKSIIEIFTATFS